MRVDKAIGRDVGKLTRSRRCRNAPTAERALAELTWRGRFSREAEPFHEEQSMRFLPAAFLAVLFLAAGPARADTVQLPGDSSAGAEAGGAEIAACIDAA